MTPKAKNRTIGSIRSELLKKSREAALAAVQIFNNPNITFKAESYIVLMIIAWTYLMHAYYRGKKIEYRYFEQHGKRRSFHKTKKGAFKHWELEKCLSVRDCPLDKDTQNNLNFLIGLRHEIEHQMTTRIDDLLSARLQACCLNYNKYIRDLFGDKQGIDRHLSFSLQLATIANGQKEMLKDHPELPPNIQSYILDFDTALSPEEFKSPQYAYRIYFVEKTANNVGQADRVVEFVKSNSPLAENLNKEYAVIKETERKKFLPSQIVEQMHESGFKKFNMHNHTQLWKAHNAKRNDKGFGVMVAGGVWYWYETWLDIVREHCESNGSKFT